MKKRPHRYVLVLLAAAGMLGSPLPALAVAHAASAVPSASVSWTFGPSLPFAATRWDDVPPEVWHQAKRSFMNLFAVALAGCRTDPVDIALQSLKEKKAAESLPILKKLNGEISSAALQDALGVAYAMTRNLQAADELIAAPLRVMPAG